MANEKLKDENRILKLNVSKKQLDQSHPIILSHEEYNIPGSLTPPQSYISVSSPERSEGASSPPTSPDIEMNSHKVLVWFIIYTFITIYLKSFIFRIKNVIIKVWLIIQD